MARKHLLASARSSARGRRGGVRVERGFASRRSATADDPNNANLTYWYWGEDDAPGANNWIKKEVALYEKAHPKVKITVVIAVDRHADLGVHDGRADQERAGHRDAVGDAARR